MIKGGHEDSEPEFNLKCELGRIEKYGQKGLAHCTENSCSIETVCSAFRKERLFPESSIEYEAQQTLKDIAIQVSFIIIDYNEENIFNKVKKTIQLCNSQTVQPISIIVVSKNDGVNYSELYDMIKVKCNVPVLLIRMYNSEANIAECIDVAVKRCTGVFYTLLDPGEELDEDFIEKLDRRINDELSPFTMARFSPGLYPKEFHGFTTQKKVHEMVGGSIDRWVGEKITDLAIEQKLERMIVRYDDLT
jgi:hypothetical protein